MPRLLERVQGTTTALWHAHRAHAVERLPGERLAAIQDRNARRMVAHAYATVPFYREAMDATGLRPEDIAGARDLALLPLVNGEQLALEPERFRSSAFEPARCLEVFTSGTSSRPKVVRYDAGAVMRAMAHRLRWKAVTRRLLGGIRRPRSLALTTAVNESVAIEEFQHRHLLMPALLGRRRDHSVASAGLAACADRLDRVRPDLLFGYGSLVGALFRWAHEIGRELHRPRLVIYAADRMSEADRTLIEQGYGIPVAASYAAMETLTLAYQCERRAGYHVQVDDVAVRVVGSDGVDVAPGGRGRIVVSNLFNRATVLLNYGLGDVVTVGRGRCPCGRTLPILECVDGRSNDWIALPDGGREHPWELVDVLEAVPGTIQVQLVQEALRRFVVRALPVRADGAAAVSRGLADALRRRLGADLEVSVELVERMPAGPTGKVRNVISHCVGAAPQSGEEPAG